jgi:hypothetical protein
MKRLSMTAAVLALAVWGCASMQSTSGNPSEVSSKPVITQSYAANEMRLGDTWKVYLRASDPGGNMKYIMVTLSQLGNAGAYPPAYIRLKGENTREFSGYIYLNTNQNVHTGGLHFTNLALSAEVKSKGGQISNTVNFPLQFTNVRQASPPAGVFQEKELGPIMISLEPPNKID